MKVLFPIGSFYPAQEGGPDNVIYWLNQELLKNGVETTVVSTMLGIRDPEISPGTETRKYGVRTYFFSYFRWHFLCFSLYRWVFVNIRKFDVVHLTSVFYPLSLIIAMIAVIKKVPFILSPHGELDEDALIYGRSKKMLFLRAVRWIFRQAVFFHATCQPESIQLAKYFDGDIPCCVIPFGLFESGQLFKQMDVRKVFFLAAGSRYLLYLGRIDPKKAIDRLIRAFDLIRDQPLTLLIAGDHRTDYGKHLVELVDELNLKDRVVFAGAVFGDLKESLLSGAELLVFPSATENFGVVVVEALNRGLPVVASKGTPWKVLEEERAGFWIRNDPSEIARTILEYLSLAAVQKDEYRRNARVLVEERFTMKSLIHQYIEMYNQAKSLHHETRRLE